MWIRLIKIFKGKFLQTLLKSFSIVWSVDKATKPSLGFNTGYNSQHHCYLVKRNAVSKLEKVLLPVKKNFNTKDTVLRINFDKFNAYFYKEKLAVQDVDEFPTSERTGNKNG